MLVCVLTPISRLLCRRSCSDHSSPPTGATCDIHLVGKLDGKVFEERKVTFFVGEASEEGVVDGVELAVRKMKKGEKCEAVVKPAYAYGPNGRPDLNIPANYEELVYEITLNTFEKAKETYQMDNNERVEQAVLVKTKGTKYFKVCPHCIECAGCLYFNLF